MLPIHDDVPTRRFPAVTVALIVVNIGVWLFYSQHQFEEAYWQRSEEWNFTRAALEGSAFLRLPRILQWFTGNIGFHHIHHLDARIPNYNLQACHESHPMFAQVTPLTAARSIRALGLKLWDEAAGRLVCFREARRPGREVGGLRCPTAGGGTALELE